MFVVEKGYFTLNDPVPRNLVDATAPTPSPLMPTSVPCTSVLLLIYIKHTTVVLKGTDMSVAIRTK